MSRRTSLAETITGRVTMTRRTPMAIAVHRMTPGHRTMLARRTMLVLHDEPIGAPSLS
ncbi:hypothetical protein [Natronococcus pandeyae]|uniref:hypothetical protein n=1 Tax=Natronococcus pandeyae TaxID=2055836 RepID=UPI001652E9EE|nr:hypothetical protein [Natronococcus pandeyae]